MIRIERFVVFQHGPGHHQHLGRQLYTDLGLDPALPLASFYHEIVHPAEGVVVIRSDQGGLEQSIAQFGITFFRDDRYALLALFATAAGVEIQAGQADHLLAAFKVQGIGQRGKDQGVDVGAEPGNGQQQPVGRQFAANGVYLVHDLPELRLDRLEPLNQHAGFVSGGGVHRL